MLPKLNGSSLEFRTNFKQNEINKQGYKKSISIIIPY